jgi:exopolysaccharide biosynthesis protein
LEPGSPVEYFAGRVLEPKLEFRALKANLEDPRLRIVVGAGIVDSVEKRPGTAVSVYVRTFVEIHGCIAGINANPFDPVSAKEGESSLVAGIAVSDGLVLANPQAGYDALVFYRNGKAGGGAAITGQGEIGDLGLIENAVGGFRMVLRQGIPAGSAGGSGENPPRHPRSAAGLSAGGSILYLLCVDGRRPGSAGAAEAELGLLLKRLGAFDGLNFDGGGSSVLALRFRDGKVRNVNIPVHGGIPGRERAVAICLGLRVR